MASVSEIHLQLSPVRCVYLAITFRDLSIDYSMVIDERWLNIQLTCSCPRVWHSGQWGRLAALCCQCWWLCLDRSRRRTRRQRQRRLFSLYSSL